MNWENLKKNLCPYCSDNLEEVPALGIWKCVQCTFNIETARKESMEKHRAHPERRPQGEKKTRWQNLREEKCPVCDTELDYGIALEGYEMFFCPNTGKCTFQISYERFQDILNDPYHSCNQFHERKRTKEFGIED